MPNMMLKFLRNDRVPLRVRKKFGKLMKPAAGMNFTVPCFGAVYGGQTGVHLDNKMYLYGGHESATLRLMRNVLRWARTHGTTPVTYVDVGVNSGAHLLCGAGASDVAYGFEPWGKIADVAQANLDRNAMTHAKIMRFGLSDVDAVLPFTPPGGSNLGVGTFMASGVRLSGEITLPVRKGDDVMAEYDIHPTLIKIDTEGFEKKVIDGLMQTIARDRPAVVFEYSSESRLDFHSLDVLQALFPEGYSFWGILPSREYPVLRPFNPVKRYENLLAWPADEAALQAAMV